MDRFIELPFHQDASFIDVQEGSVWKHRAAERTCVVLETARSADDSVRIRHQLGGVTRKTVRHLLNEFVFVSTGTKPAESATLPTFKDMRPGTPWEHRKTLRRCIVRSQPAHETDVVQVEHESGRVTEKQVHYFLEEFQPARAAA